MTKTVLITGATSGIGEATAKLFAQQGHHLIITGRRKERLEKLKSDLSGNTSIKITTLCFDIRNFKETESAIKTLIDNNIKIDVLINNAGLAAGLSTIDKGSIDDWERMIDTNVKGLLYITRLVAPLMIENKTGHIVNISSVAGKEVYPNGNVYCATKHAVDALSKAMRMDMFTHGIKVTNIAPGMAETEFSIVRFNGDEARANQVYQGVEPLTAEDIAETIYWAVSRPTRVSINDITLTPICQASSRDVIRK